MADKTLFDETVTTTLVHCARCGGHHDNLPFKIFTRPVMEHADIRPAYTHWAMCPESKQPILLKVLPEPD